MKKWLVFTLALLVLPFTSNESFGEKSTSFDSVKFIQYLDENTALEEVRNGNLDLYYYRISSDRLEDNHDREGLQIFDSTGGSYSILVNPAESDEFNPFSDRDIRYAMNYLIDRKLIVNELMGGYGKQISSYYGPSDPDYLTVIEQLETFNFKYNPNFAKQIITEKLTDKGAIKNNGTWTINSSPIEITIFIRSDDPVRKSIGEILAIELQRMGFVVNKDFGDLNKAFVIVYGSDPRDLKWNLYIEGWNRSAFVKYDSAGIGQMYAPWFSYMPGFNDPTYWNYENAKLDNITQRIYTGNFESSKERTSLIQEAVVEGINESVRIFLASKIDQYVVNEGISGIINDFGAGVPSRFTPINAKGNDGELVIGVKQIYQGSWNPIMGFTDSYSRHVWGIMADPGVFKHPHSGETFPVRANWKVDTAGPAEKIKVPDESKLWNSSLQKWENVTKDTFATSKVTFDFEYSKWHNGQQMNSDDLLYSLYFLLEWGIQEDGNDRTFDSEFTPRAAQKVQTVKGINQIDENTIEVYVDYWHFDEGEIASWAEVLWTSVPWEISAAMEKAVIDGKVSFSRSGATSKNVNWLSLIIPNDAEIIKENLHEFKSRNFIPSALKERGHESEYYQNRYEASIKWIEDNNHAAISNGPFYLESYIPESRTMTVKTFEDKSYPFPKNQWNEFEKAEVPTITKVKIGETIKRGEQMEIDLEVDHSDSLLYFLINSNGEKIKSEVLEVNKKENTIRISSEDTKKFEIGGNSIKIFAISASVQKPDFYETSFIVTDGNAKMSNRLPEDLKFQEDEKGNEFLLFLIPIIGFVTIWIYFRRRKS